jgi:hypothetical protein
MTDTPDAVNEQRQILESTWRPFEEQQAIMQHPARFRVCVCGRRWGKSEMAAHEALEYALETQDATVWWVGPTYEQANSYGFDKIKRLLSYDVIADDPKLSKPRKIDLVTGSTLSFRSAEREDSLRGGGVDFLVIDEAGSVPTRAWTEVLRPTLADTRGRLLAIGTPKRRNWFYDLFQRGRSEEHPEVAAFQAPTESNPHVPDEEVAHARATNPERVFRQEWQAEFLDETGGVFTDLESRVLREYDPDAVDGDEPYATGVDFARSEDYTVIVTLDGDGQLVHFDRVRKVGWPEIQRRVERANDRYTGVAALDATRDNAIVSNLQDAGVTVEPVEFTAKTKRSLIENLVTAVENEELTLPDQDPLVHELEVFERDTTESGNVRYGAPSGFKDDCVDALALANHVRGQRPKRAGGFTIAAEEPATVTRSQRGRRR